MRLFDPVFAFSHQLSAFVRFRQNRQKTEKTFELFSVIIGSIRRLSRSVKILHWVLSSLSSRESCDLAKIEWRIQEIISCNFFSL